MNPSYSLVIGASSAIAQAIIEEQLQAQSCKIVAVTRHEAGLAINNKSSRVGLGVAATWERPKEIRVATTTRYWF